MGPSCFAGPEDYLGTELLRDRAEAQSLRHDRSMELGRGICEIPVDVRQ